ncbi:MAG TPA: NADH-quinone oxidoreductase subunit L [Verrucomicrobia bacterium]|nr:NADH-quinone oxidoreductase subunit L [Verrucomicrobiota bacterium]
MPLLVVLQTGLMIYSEFFGGVVSAERDLSVDNLSVIMAMIVGVVGGLISIYSLWYMKDYHAHHPEIPNRTRSFFFVVFVFLAAMFGIVFSNNLRWMYFFWEVTSVCSFWLIGYSQTEEAVQNAFRALKINLLGGLSFALGIVYLAFVHKTVDMSQLLAMGQAAALIPAMFIAFAGLTKSAQMPFSSWLLGAMVAPTPVSALLHSSTMVKAGVYVIIKMAPILQNTAAGFVIALIGGVTFLLASATAVSQNNAKRVLAYSTIANLGLIVACGGVGTFEAVWAAILLVVFHAVAKGLLFLTVGTIEHEIGSRDIEDMHGLITRSPALAIFMLIGIAGMFLAPFGMLISKWVTLKAFIDSNPILAILLAFGSAPTLFFWAKWMGKLLAVPHTPRRTAGQIEPEEWTALLGLAVLTIGACGLFPLIAAEYIEPYTMQLYGHAFSLGYANLAIMGIMLGALILLPLGFFYFPKNLKYEGAYMAGANLPGNLSFQGSLGQPRDMIIRNVYFRAYFNEASLSRLGNWITVLLIVLMFVTAEL